MKTKEIKIGHNTFRFTWNSMGDYKVYHRVEGVERESEVTEDVAELAEEWILEWEKEEAAA